MTNDEKAKAYEMALEAARKELGVDRKEWEVVKRVLHNIFPELRESEDERIRQGLLKIFKQSPNGYWAGMEIKDIVAYLEKRKESLRDFIDDFPYSDQQEQKPSTGIYWHAIKKGDKIPCRAYLYKVAYETENNFGGRATIDGLLVPNIENVTCGCDTWYLPADDVKNLPREGLDELQKENPKYADPIPADCVSNAKCEDRWHKVQDSLPDNGRLVLANDCLGNMLLARYDGEGNWEVSVYDNDDYYCRNTITKWCEIPSEKQKEQKPNSTEDMPYVADERFYEREPADSFKYKLAEYMTKRCTKKEGPYGYSYSISSESILELAKEELIKRGVVQKPAEWSEEDENAITTAIRACRYMTENFENSTEQYEDATERLKSLRPGWKPSEEQIYSLGTVVKGSGECSVGSVGYNLKELYEQLKKL